VLQVASGSLPDERRFLYAEFTATSESAAAKVEELLALLAVAVREEPGNIAFDAYRKRDDPTGFFVYEIYEDEAAFQLHLRQEHGRAFNAELAHLVQGGASELTWLSPLQRLPGGPM
jgi:quinol monooxygenase YgiN